MADGNYEQTQHWVGVSKQTFKYWVYPIGTSLKPEGGNYIFAKLDMNGRWVPVYIGQTSNLAERFDDHHAAPCILRNGATHIHAHLSADKHARVKEETDLRANYRTACNKQ